MYTYCIRDTGLYIRFAYVKHGNNCFKTYYMTINVVNERSITSICIVTANRYVKSTFFHFNIIPNETR